MILGIYHPAEGIGHDSAVALIDANGQILAAQSEERFSRIKMDGGFPFRSFEALRKRVPFEPKDLEAVAIPYWSGMDKMREGGNVLSLCARKPGFVKEWLEYRGLDPFQKEMSELGAYQYLPEYLEQISKIYAEDHRPGLKNWMEFLRFAGLDKVPVVRVDHHIAHAAGAYFTSGWPEALVVTADGVGALKSGLVAVGKEGRLEVLARTFLPNSPGRFWEAVTHLCGFNHHKHGGKTTGLAASGDPEAESYPYFKSILGSQGMTVSSRLSPLEMARQLEGISREDLAATAQRRLEEVMCTLIREAVHETGIHRLALAGGVFSNVLLNQKLFELPEVEDIYIFPAMGDEGLAVGAALWALSRKGKWMPYGLENLYLGPEFSEKEMEEALCRARLPFTRLESPELIDQAVQLLVSKKVIGYYEGRMEYGPRALGHRSILYTTQDPSVNDWLNKRLQRSEFMPFAPVTLQDKASECYENIRPFHYPARFMTITYQCSPKMKKESPAVVHKDGTARPQLIDKTAGRYYQILKAYHQRTGIPSLINTSFNMHEEPIVCSPQDAIRAFVEGGLDHLILGPFLVDGKVRNGEPS